MARYYATAILTLYLLTDTELIMKPKFKQAVREAQALLPDTTYICHAYEELAYNYPVCGYSALHDDLYRYLTNIFRGCSIEVGYGCSIGMGDDSATVFHAVSLSTAEWRNKFLRYELTRYVAHLYSTGVPPDTARGLIYRRIKNWIKKNHATWEAQNV